MDVLDQLNAWLEQPVYENGVMLYQQIIGSDFILRMLKTGKDEHNRQTLTSALTAKRDELAASAQAKIEAYPEVLLDSLENAKSLMDERTALKERMRMRYQAGVTESQEIKDWAFRILSIGDQLNEIYGRRHFFDEHGYLPVEIQEDVNRTPAQLYQRILTLRTYVSRETKKLNRLPTIDERYEPTRLKLQGFQSELHQLNEQYAALINPNGPIQLP